MLRSLVLDTNVVVAAARSRRGSSFRILQLVGSGLFEISVSVPLVLEYEAVLLRQLDALFLDEADVSDLLDYLCRVANKQRIFYLWRPRLQDPSDELVLELAVAAACDSIITFNKKDFAGAEAFGIRVISPADFLREIGVTT